VPPDTNWIHLNEQKESYSHKSEVSMGQAADLDFDSFVVLSSSSDNRLRKLKSAQRAWDSREQNSAEHAQARTVFRDQH